MGAAPGSFGLLWAVHISDGILSTPWTAAGFAVMALLMIPACFRVRDEEIPRIALLTAAFFVASLIHIRVGPTSCHLLLNGLLGVILGRRAALAIFVVALAPAAVWPREYANVGQRFFFAWNPKTWAAPQNAVPYDLDVPTKDILTARGRPVTFSVRLLPKHDNVSLPTRSTLVLIDDNGQVIAMARGADASHSRNRGAPPGRSSWAAPPRF